MTPRERKYHQLKKDFKFWNKFFKGDVTIEARPFMFFSNTPEGIKITEDTKPSEPVTITITKYNLFNNISLSEGQLN